MGKKSRCQTQNIIIIFLLQMVGNRSKHFRLQSFLKHLCCFPWCCSFLELIHYGPLIFAFFLFLFCLCWIHVYIMSLVLVLIFEMCLPCVPNTSVIYPLGTGVEAGRSPDWTSRPAEKIARKATQWPFVGNYGRTRQLSGGNECSFMAIKKAVSQEQLAQQTISGKNNG